MDEIAILENEIQKWRANALPPLLDAKDRLEVQIVNVQTQIDGLQEQAKEAALQAALGATTDSLQASTVNLSAAKGQLELLRMAHGEVVAKNNQETNYLNELIAARDRAVRIKTVRALADAKLLAATRIADMVASLRILLDEYDAVGAKIEAAIPQPDHKMREKLGQLRGRGRVLSFVEHVVECYPTPWPPFLDWEREAAAPFLNYSD